MEVNEASKIVIKAMKGRMGFRNDLLNAILSEVINSVPLMDNMEIP